MWLNILFITIANNLHKLLGYSWQTRRSAAIG
jgi:hypothetical protein